MKYASSYLVAFFPNSITTKDVEFTLISTGGGYKVRDNKVLYRHLPICIELRHPLRSVYQKALYII